MTTQIQDRTDSVRFTAVDVTGVRRIEVADLQAHAPAGEVAAALAEQMQLPANTPWSIRTESTRMLPDDAPIGTLAPGERVTLVPRAHLG